MILLLHAYSRANSGDGLLVDLSIELLRKALGDAASIGVVAMDRESFSDLSPVFDAPTSFARPLEALGKISLLMGKTLAFEVFGRQFKLGELSALMNRSRLLVGVGGGYMRSGNCIEGLKSGLAHVPQALNAQWSGRPSVYLPQSVGPFNGPFGNLMKDTLKSMSRLYLRDNRSLQAMQPSARTVVRAPDLAVMKLASGRDPGSFSSRYSNFYVVARDLPLPGSLREIYIDKLRALKRLIPSLNPVLQSSGRGNNDALFCKKIGWGDKLPTLKTAIAESGPGVVISVRLHGSLQALISGCPSVHIAYERKGFGAYEDLNISSYVHAVSQFSPEVVSEQARELASDAKAFWADVSAATMAIRSSEDALIGDIQEVYASC